MTDQNTVEPIVVDARGLACPQPVVLTKKALDKADRVTIIVDNETAMRNVSRLAKSQGCQISIEQREDDTYLYLSGRGIQDRETPTIAVTKTVLLVGSSTLGHGDDELGNVLMRSFMHTVGELENPPAEIIFMNSGVKLVTDGSQVVEDLRALEQQGLEILACGTCLDYYKLKKSVQVGRISNMYDITSALFAADRIISI